MGDVVADRRDQAFPVGGELDPAVVLGRLGDEGAAALERLHQAFALQQVDGLAHGDAGDAELVLQLLQRGDLGADRPVAVADTPAQHGSHLQIARHAAVGVGPTRGVRARLAMRSSCTVRFRLSDGCPRSSRRAIGLASLACVDDAAHQVCAHQPRRVDRLSRRTGASRGHRRDIGGELPAAASAASMSTASKAILAPGVMRPSAGMSAEMTVATWDSRRSSAGPPAGRWASRCPAPGWSRARCRRRRCCSPCYARAGPSSRMPMRSEAGETV